MLKLAIGTFLFSLSVFSTNAFHIPKPDGQEKEHEKLNEFVFGDKSLQSYVAKDALYAAMLPTEKMWEDDSGLFDFAYLGKMAATPLTMLIGVPLGALGAAGGVIEKIHHKIHARDEKKQFDDEMAANLFDWIAISKEARQNMNARLKKVQEEHGKLEGSIKEEVIRILMQSPNDYDSHSWDREIKLLQSIEPCDDTRKNFFPTLSQKLKEIHHDLDWNALQAKLHACSQKKTKLSTDDIDHYLPAAVYLFDRASRSAIGVLKAFINE